MEEKEVLIKELKLLYKEQEILQKQSVNYEVINKLLSIEGHNLITNYVQLNNLNRVIIYGAGTIGKILFDIIKKVCNVEAIIDENNLNKFEFYNTNIINCKDIYKLKYDRIIITPIHSYNIIKSILEEKKIDNFVLVTNIIKMYMTI